MKHESFIQWAIAYLSSPAGIPSLVILAGVIGVLSLRFLAGHKREVEYAKTALNTIKNMINGQLGSKADAVIDAWLEGIAAIEDGDFTTQEMVTEFVKFIKIALNDKQVELTPDEEEVVGEAASLTVQMMAVKSKPTKKAVALMMSSR